MDRDPGRLKDLEGLANQNEGDDADRGTAQSTMRSPRFQFRPLAEADLPRLCEWLNRPHLQKWWRAGETSLTEVREKYLPRMAGEDAAQPFFAFLQGEPVGYVQYYLASEGADWWPDNLRAIRCYAKAGFREVGPITTPDGPALLMVLEREPG